MILPFSHLRPCVWLGGGRGRADGYRGLPTTLTVALDKLARVPEARPHDAERVSRRCRSIPQDRSAGLSLPER